MDINGIYYCSKCMRRIEEEKICPHCGYDHQHSRNRSSELEIGTLLNSRYQLGSVIGRGGFGLTYAAWDETLEIPVAVKEYYPSTLVVRNTEYSDEVETAEENETFYYLGLQRYINESRVLAMMKDVPGVVTVQDYFEENNTAYIVMEFIHGITLGKYAKKYKLSSKEFFQMLENPINALIALHKNGIVHCDITPANLMVQDDGSVKLIDFGAASAINREQSRIMATDRYAAIEQYNSTGLGIGTWTDIYGLCAVIYDILTGNPPPESVLRVHRDELVAIEKTGVKLKKYQAKAIMSGLVLEPVRRTQSMAEFRARLYHLLLPEEVLERKRFMRKVGTITAAGAAVLVITLANFGIGLPLGKGLLYTLRLDGFHIVDVLKSVEKRILPKAILGIPVVSIEDNAFANDGELNEAVIPGNIEYVGTMAFNGCENLEKVYLEDGVKEIADYAFADCSNFNELRIPASVENIASNICINAPDLLAVWGVEASAAQVYAEEAEISFVDEQEYTFEENETGVTLTACEADDEKVVLPDMAQGQKVTALREETGIFSESIASLEFPEYLISMPAGALANHTNLSEVQLGNSLEQIGEMAFMGTSLNGINIPSSVKRVEMGAFYQCIFPFITLQEGLEYIGELAFAESFLEEVQIPDTVTEIGDSAFMACTSLKKAVLSGNMGKVSDGLFEGCTSLTEVTIPEGLESIGLIAFGRCSSLESIELPKGMTTIEAYAFSECVRLKNIHIPATVEKIHETAFDGCPESMVISGFSGTTAERFAKTYGYEFLDMSRYDLNMGVSSSGSLIIDEAIAEQEEIILPAYFKEIVVKRVMEASNLKSRKVIMPKHLEEITTNSFAGNIWIEEIQMDEGLTSIGDVAFWNCSNLKKIDLPEGLVSIGTMAFAGCDSLEDMKLPDSVEEIGWNAFYNCKELKEISIPESLTVLEEGCFGGTAIKEITIPSNITKCRVAFYDCDNLKKAILEEGVRTIWGSFAQCSALETVIIPSTVTQISRSTFQGCSNLKDVWIYSEDVDLDFVWPSLSIDVWNGGEVEAELGTALDVVSVVLETNTDETPILFSDSPNVTIHGYAGSTAEAFATEHGLKFEMISNP